MKHATWMACVIAMAVTGLNASAWAQSYAQTLATGQALALAPDRVLTVRSYGGTIQPPGSRAPFPSDSSTIAIDLTCALNRHRAACKRNPGFDDDPWLNAQLPDYTQAWQRRAIDTLLQRMGATDKTKEWVATELSKEIQLPRPDIAPAFPNTILLSGFKWRFDAERQSFYVLDAKPFLLGFLGQSVNHQVNRFTCLYEPAFSGKSSARFTMAIEFSDIYHFFLKYDGRWVSIFTNLWPEGSKVLEPFRPNGPPEVLYRTSEGDMDWFLFMMVNRYVFQVPNAE